MAYQAIGKIAMTPKGEWTADNPYQQLDIVTYENNIYIALNDIPKNIKPSTLSDKWQLLLTTEEIQSNLNNQINVIQNLIDHVDSDQKTLENTINIIKNLYGAPAKASSVAEMTDTNRVYVYTGETIEGFKKGFWYYYDNLKWVEGGLYNNTAIDTDKTLSITDKPADAKVTGDSINQLKNALSSTNFKSGSLITMNNTINAPLKNLIIYGKSIQNGTPSPLAPASIVTAGSSGSIQMVGAGKNMIKYVAALRDVGDSMTSLGLTVKHLADGGLSIVGTTSNSGNLIISGLNNSNSLQIPDGRYTLTQVSSGLPSSSNVYMWLKSGQTKFAPSTFDFVRNEVDASANIGITFSAGVEVNCTIYPMLRLTEITDVAFAPYNGITAVIPTPNGLPGIPVTNGGNYTDTSGQQWICDTIDLETGTWTKRCGVVTFDGQSASGWERVNAANSKYRFRNTSLTSTIMKAATNNAVVPLLCTHYAGTSANATWTNTDVDGIAVDNGGGIFVADAALRDAGTLEQFLARFQATAMTIVYPLAAPEVVQLTTAQLTALHSLYSRQGITNIYSADLTAPEFEAELFISMQSSLADVLTKTNSPSVNNTGKIVTINGTVDAPPAELIIYGRSVQDGTPAPDAPADIVTAGSGGTLSMVSAGKNLLDVAAFTQDAGSSISRIDAQSGTIVVVSSGGTYRSASNHSITLLPGVTYVCSGNVAGTDGGTSRVAVRNATDVIKASNTTGAIGVFSFTFTPTEPGWYVSAFASLGTSATGSVTYTGLQIEIATAATDFAPYNCVAAAIPTPNGLPGVPVASGGNYTDTSGRQWICDTIDLEMGTWTKRCGVVTLNGTENWFASTQVTGRYYLASTYTPNAVPYASHLCTHAVANPGSPTSDTGKSFFASGANFDINTEYASVDAFKAALAANNMTLIYQLAAPVVTQLTNTQLAALNSIRSRKEQTNLYSIDPSAPEIDAKMYINFQNYIQPLINKQHKFRVCSWNMGNFAYGDLSGGTSENSNRKSNTSNRRGPIGNDTMYDQMINAFNESQADIYLFCEWNRYWNKNWTTIDTTQDIEAMTVLEGLKPYWTSHNPSARTDKYAGHKIASNWPIIYEYAVAYGNDEDRYFVGAVCSIAGREVHFVSVHFNPNSAGSAENIDEGGTSTAKTRRREFKILQDYLTSINAKYIVLAGDFNLGGPNATAQTALNDLQMFKDAGYTCMQGGFFGKRIDNNLFDTLNADEWPRGNSSIRPYDNIAISNNMCIINAQVITQNGSDHYPIIADIVFKDDKN